jgi:5-methylcytosine-specific restriction endonuclease McrA
MTMSAPYQPVIIRALLATGGTLTRRQLAEHLLLADDFQLKKMDAVLMRWPLRTLTKHGLIRYDIGTKTFRLLAELDDAEAAAIATVCDQKIAIWNRQAAPKRASRFYGVIERAGGRCEACGVLGTDRALDVDHVVPQSQANPRGEVRLPSGQWVPVHDERNLQALCYVCNRGKRDASTTDFRPTIERLAETIVLAERRALQLGYEHTDLEIVAEALRQHPGLMTPVVTNNMKEETA